MNIITQHMFSPIRTLIENEIKEGLSEIDNNGNIHEITYIHIKVINGLTRYIIPTDLYFRSPVVTILPFEILRNNFCIPYTEMDSLYGEGYDNDNSDSMYYICLLKGWKDENKDEPLKNNILSNDCSQIHKYNYELLSFTELELCE